MDFFDECILTALKDGKPRSFSMLQSQVSFSHNTLHHHLKELVDRGLILREKDHEQAFGRPRSVYYVTGKTAKHIATALEDPSVELVTVPFSRVRHICRFEKGGYCKEKKTSCSPQICPQIRK